MPETEDTRYTPSIPLRDNGSRHGLGAHATPQPNPYTRLEALNVVHQRIGALADLLAARSQAADVVGLGAVLQAMYESNRTALWGDLEAVEHLRDESATLGLWLDAVEGVLWPASRAGGDTAAEPGR